MKTHRFLLQAIFALVFAFLELSCNSGNDSVKQADKINDQKEDAGAVAKVDDDLEFVTDAASGGMMEIELGNAAATQASDPQVKEFGAMMVSDHTGANAELKMIAATKNITLPAVMGKKHQKTVDDIMKKTGADFDKAYMDMTVEDHKEDIEKYGKQSIDGKDSDIKAFASKTLPVLQQHLEAANAIQNAMDKKK